MNDLNQLTTGNRSGTLTVAGTSGAAATSVTVNGSASTRYGDGTFAKEGLNLSDGNNTFTAIAQDSLGRLATNSVTVWLPAGPSWTYDANGNLTGDGKRVFGYDDENQLIWVYVTNAWKSGFTYDGKLRRRERAESTWVSGTWKTNVVVRYIYDGMRVVQERHFQPQVSMTLPFETATYTRGWDLSASLEGAGGIGGLLARTDSSGTAYYHADGNGNVTALLNASQAVVARYLYDPFGNTLSASGPLADANLYRFSSKELHANSGLYYYGYRFYEPNLQRWPNADPQGIRGGPNLHSFVLNEPVGWIDPLGLQCWGYGGGCVILPPGSYRGFGLPGKSAPSPYVVDPDGSFRVRKCNIVIFVGHTGPQRTLPPKIRNDDCSAASVVSCEASDIEVENPILGIEPRPRGNIGLPEARRIALDDFQRAVELARRMECCDKVTITIVNRPHPFEILAWPRGLLGQQKVVKVEK